MTRNLKRSRSSDQDQLRSKRRAQTQEEPRINKVKFERGGGSEYENPTCVTCGKSHYGKCLPDTSGFFDCGKDYNKVRDCPTIEDRGREGNQVSPNVPKEDAPNRGVSTHSGLKNQSRIRMRNDGKFWCFFSGMSSF